MKIHGTIDANLTNAIASAERFKGRQIYAETLDHWKALLQDADRLRADQQSFNDKPNDTLIARLQRLIAERPQ